MPARQRQGPAVPPRVSASQRCPPLWTRLTAGDDSLPLLAQGCRPAAGSTPLPALLPSARLDGPAARASHRPGCPRRWQVLGPGRRLSPGGRGQALWLLGPQNKPGMARTGARPPLLGPRSWGRSRSWAAGRVFPASLLLGPPGASPVPAVPPLPLQPPPGGPWFPGFGRWRPSSEVGTLELGFHVARGCALTCVRVWLCPHRSGSGDWLQQQLFGHSF